MLSTAEIESLLVFASVLLQGKKYHKVITIGRALEALKISSPSMMRMHASACIESGEGREALRILAEYPEEVLSDAEKQLFILMKASALWNIRNKKSAFMEIKKFIAMRT